MSYSQLKLSEYIYSCNPASRIEAPQALRNRIKRTRCMALAVPKILAGKRPAARLLATVGPTRGAHHLAPHGPSAGTNSDDARDRRSDWTTGRARTSVTPPHR